MKKFQVWVSIIAIVLLATNIGLSITNIVMTDNLITTNKQVAQDVKRLKVASKEIQEEDRYNEYLGGAQSYLVGQ